VSIWLKLLMIGTMLGIDLVIWKIVQSYERRGVILAFPRNLERVSKPNLFRANMIVLWASLVLCVAFTVVATVVLISVN